jgi:hypothetical protein
MTNEIAIFNTSGNRNFVEFTTLTLCEYKRQWIEKNVAEALSYGARTISGALETESDLRAELTEIADAVLEAEDADSARREMTDDAEYSSEQA